MELHGWSRGRGKYPRIWQTAMGTFGACLALMAVIAVFHSGINAFGTSAPQLSFTSPAWAPPGWKADDLAGLVTAGPRKSTFGETLFALPLSLGWWVRAHATWGLAILFFGVLIFCAIWRGAARALGSRKPAVLFPALIMLQCAALGWGWTYFAAAPYQLETKLTVVDFKSTFPTLLTTNQQISWYQQNGYDGYTLNQPANAKNESSSILIPLPAAQGYSAQLAPNATWWIFPKGTASLYGLNRAWKIGKVAAISLENPPPQISVAGKCNIVLSIIALLAAIAAWCVTPAAATLSAPGRVANFLQKRRFRKRLAGLLMMLLAFAGTLLALWLTFYPAWGFVRLETLSLGTTAILWIMLDFCYWQGRKSWTKIH